MTRWWIVAMLGVSGFVLLAVQGVLAQTLMPAVPLTDMTLGHFVVVATNLGLSGVFLFFLLHSLRRQTAIEELNRRYDESSRLSMTAFRETMDAYRALVSAQHEVALANVNLQTRLIDKVATIEHRLGKSSQ